MAATGAVTIVDVARPAGVSRQTYYAKLASAVGGAADDKSLSP